MNQLHPSAALLTGAALEPLSPRERGWDEGTSKREPPEYGTPKRPAPAPGIPFP